ncbi:hypothetical protein ACTXT7_004256 [Hymenolepis weldensis]
MYTHTFIGKQMLWRKKRPKLDTDEISKPHGKSASQGNYNTLISDSSTNASRCKSESTEPFSTPEPCSPPDTLLSNSTQTKTQRLDASTITSNTNDQPTSLRFPNLLADDDDRHLSTREEEIPNKIVSVTLSNIFIIEPCVFINCCSN